MKTTTAVMIGLALSSFMITAMAEEGKPYKEGQVTSVTFVKTKPGKFDDYLKYLDTKYKAEMEAEKTAGIVTRYAVMSATPHNPNDPDLILTVTYPNMAALDRGEEMDAISAKLEGSLANANKGFADRESIRQILGSELVRELILK